MRLIYPASLAGLSLLAGCAAPRPVAQQEAVPAQGVSYTAQVVAVRPVSAGLALGQVMQALGQQAPEVSAPAQEVVVKLPDGSVKSLVPPPGAAPASLAPGAQVVISESPALRITAQ